MNEKAGVERRTVTFPSHGVDCAGWYFLPTARHEGGRLPGIVMAHGWSGVKEMYLTNFAEPFAAAGFAVLVFDYRGFGESGGEPRQQILPNEQQRDYRSAISFLAAQSEVDPDRIGIWGTSYSGGLVLDVAVDDRQVKAVVAQVPAVNTSATPWHWMRTGQYRHVWHGIRLLVKQALLPWSTVYIPVISDHDGPATLPGAEAFAWVSQGALVAPHWSNQVTVWSLLAATTYRAAHRIGQIAPTPLLLIAASEDRYALTDECRKAFAAAREPKQLVVLEGGHFDFYAEPGLSRILPIEIDWFTRHLRGASETIPRAAASQ